MPYPEVKVYFDGSHYIAIPHTTKPYKPRPKKREEVITVKPSAEESSETVQEMESAPPIDDALSPLEKIAVTSELPNDEKPTNVLQPNERRMTKKELFNELYQEYLFLKKRERREKITTAIRPYFKTRKAAEIYVDSNLERKKRNLICRRVRMTRKANLADFNYFVTLTYDGNLHTEESFKKKLKNCLSLFCSRKGWKYIGVWERSPEKQRLHFHGIFDIPDGTMPGLLFEKSDYNFKSHRRQITVQNTYFNENFGRSDFEKIEGHNRIGNAMAYIMKYLEKSGERIVYSKGLPQFFITDILDEDVIATVGMEDKKLLLYDDFGCWDEGEYIGTVSADIIRQMRKSN